MFLSGRSLQQSDANQTSVEVYVCVSSALKHQFCRNLFFWKFVSLDPICKKGVRLRPECFLSIREYASYYRLPLWRRVVGQYFELETLPYLNFRFHLTSLYVLSFRITNAPCRETWLVQRIAASSGLVDVTAPRPPMDACMNCVGVRVGRKMMARETALRVIAFHRLHRGLSGWRSLSAKTRVNLGLAPGGCWCAKDALSRPSSVDDTC